ncbi:MCR_0457 family protein [Acinetobacter sp. MD2(2019)]|uniref:MCR_0457 family protein n=1 Tax=Acinetobacter sp. MD2(2019) TaxID=2605273 RepID=UPI002D1F74D4|nr:hypothetical protein [Acinetobacter sp. MD2(2019)]MEB3753783.1 hypothetical protein [Acinetobacter sp. MD2(2019)]
MNRLIKKFILGLCSTTILCMSYAQAQPEKTSSNKSAETENIEVTPDHNSVTSEELAAIYVLSKLCNGYGFKNQNFKDGYTSLVKENLPDVQNPVQALEKIAKDKSFKKYLTEAEQDAKKAGDEQNKEICQEISTLSNTKKP